MKKITAILLVLFFLVPNLAFAEEQKELMTLTKEYEFETTNHIFKYEPPNEITEGGMTYQNKSINCE